MHPPPFHLDHRLSDWPACHIELRCPGCGQIVVSPIGLLIRKRGDQTFRVLLGRLICHRCGMRPAPVYLCAGHTRVHCGGGPPDWAIELIAAPKSSSG